LQKETFNVKDYGASGDREQLATLFIRNGIDICSSKNVVISDSVIITGDDSTVLKTRSLGEGVKVNPVENIRMTNVQIFMDPENAIDKRSNHAIKFENVKELRIRDLSVKWSEDQTEKGWQSALALKNVSDADIRSFSGRQGLKNSDHPAILLTDVSEVLISESRTTEGCGTFIHVQGENSNETSMTIHDTNE
jgi:hypothetical protein